MSSVTCVKHLNYLGVTQLRCDARGGFEYEILIEEFFIFAI